jgi:hypothetical protein
MEHELLEEYFQVAIENDADGFYPTTVLFQEIQKKAKGLQYNNGSVTRLGKALHAMGFLRLKRKGRQVWAVKARIVTVPEMKIDLN